MDDYLAAEASQRASNAGMRIREHIARVVEPSIRGFAVSVVVEVAAIVVLLVAPVRCRLIQTPPDPCSSGPRRRRAMARMRTALGARKAQIVRPAGDA